MGDFLALCQQKQRFHLRFFSRVKKKSVNSTRTKVSSPHHLTVIHKVPRGRWGPWPPFPNMHTKPQHKHLSGKLWRNKSHNLGK